jgi:DNA-binding Xre family transcriptional regulator
MKKPLKPQSTYETEIGDQRFRKLFEKEYGELILSELILAMMAEDNVSVRKLAKQIGVAPSVVQSVRSGKHKNITLKTFIKMIAARGGEIAVKRGGAYVSLKLAA